MVLKFAQKGLLQQGHLQSILLQIEMSTNTKFKLLLVLALMVCGAMGNVFQGRSLQGTCCSTCFEATIPYSRMFVSKLQSFSMIFLANNYTTSLFVQVLTGYPRKLITQLYKGIVDFEEKKAAGLASCGGTDEELLYYGGIDDQIIETMAESLPLTINMQVTPSQASLNRRKTRAKFVNGMIQGYSQFKALQTTTSQSLQARKQVLMAIITTHLHRFTRSKRVSSMFNCFRGFSRNLRQHSIPNQQLDEDYLYFIVEQYMNAYQEDYEDLLTQWNQHQAIQFFLENHEKNAACVLDEQYENLSTNESTSTNGSARLLQAPQLIDLFNIPLERSSPTQPLFSMPVMTEMAQVSFDGLVEQPEDPNSEPNGGYDLGEDAADIWGEILANSFSSMLACKMPDLKNLMEQYSCPATCQTTC